MTSSTIYDSLCIIRHILCLLLILEIICKMNCLLYLRKVELGYLILIYLPRVLVALNDEMAYNIDSLISESDTLCAKLNYEQRQAFDCIVSSCC